MLQTRAGTPPGKSHILLGGPSHPSSTSMKRAFQFLQQLRTPGVRALKSDAGPVTSKPPTLPSFGEKMTAAQSSVRSSLGQGMSYLQGGWSATQATLHNKKDRIASGISYGANKILEAPQAYARERMRRFILLSVGISCAVAFSYALGSALPDAILRYTERQKKEQQP